MNIEIIEEVPGGIEAEFTYPPCPNCGATGVLLGQTSEIINNRFVIVDVYACPVCQPELVEK